MSITIRKLPLRGQETISPHQLHCPACGQQDLWNHVHGFVLWPINIHQTKRPAQHHRTETITCHSCGVTGTNWNKLTKTRAKTQHSQGLLVGLAFGITCGGLAGILLTTISSSTPAPAPTPIATHTTQARTTQTQR